MLKRLLTVLLLLVSTIGAANAANFSVSGGKIYDPDGKEFFAAGLNIGAGSLSGAISDANCRPLTTIFPSVNFVRVPAGNPAGYADHTNYDTVVARAAACKIVLEFEDHPFPSPLPYTGTQLQTELDWYKGMATAYKNQPYVWFGSMNEPSTSYCAPGTTCNSPCYGCANSFGDIANQEIATYNEIRTTAAAPNMIMLEAGVGAGYPGSTGCYMQASDFNTMTGIIWDLHWYPLAPAQVIYGDPGNFTSITQAQSDTAFVGSGNLANGAGCTGVSGAQNYQSKDGKVPVVIGEFSGNENNYLPWAPSGDIVVATVGNPANGQSGFAGWSWDQGQSFITDVNRNGSQTNNVTDSGNAQFGWGNKLAPLIAAHAGGGGGTITPPNQQAITLNAVSNNKTPIAATFTLTGSIQGFSSAPTLQYQDNGGSWVSLPGGSSVTTSAFSFVHPAMTANAQASVAVRVSTATTITASFALAVYGPETTDKTAVTATGAGNPITDQTGNVYYISAGQQVVFNAAVQTGTSNVTELYYVNHTAYQKNSAGSWYSFSVVNGTLTGAGPVTDPTQTQTATPGVWQSVDYVVPGVTLPSKGSRFNTTGAFHFNYVLPTGYTTTTKWPVMIWLHPDLEGNTQYNGGTKDNLLNLSEAIAFNSAAFRSSVQWIIMVPYADQTDGNGNNGDDSVVNWGGWSNNGTTGTCTHSSGDFGPNTCAVLGMVDWAKTNLSVDTNRVYLQGFSLGGIGTEYMMLHYNMVNGSQKYFAAGMSTAGVIESNGYNTGPTSTDLATLKQVPHFWNSGATDNQSFPSHWNDKEWSGYTNNTTYPDPKTSTTAAAATASGTQFVYWRNPRMGHDDYDENGTLIHTMPAVLNWLNAQSATGGGGSVCTTPASADNTVITTVGPTFNDANCNTWGLNSSGQVVLNGAADTTSSNANELAWEVSKIWYRNSTGGWFYRVLKTDSWTGPSTTSPVPGDGSSSTLTNWYNSPGIDLGFWRSPFYTNATWTTSGSGITLLRNGTHSVPFGYVHQKGDFSAPMLVGTSNDPDVSITDGTKTITAHIPLGAITEEPTGLNTDSSIGGEDAGRPYMTWSCQGAVINTSSVAATGSKITCVTLEVDDGSGHIMEDQVTGQSGAMNAFGGITDYDLSQLRSNSTYVIPHMLAYSLDPAQIKATGPTIWPLSVLDNSLSNTGTLSQGYTIGIPKSTTRPTGKSRGFYALFDNAQQYGWFFYNVAQNGGLSLFEYSTNTANTTLATDIATPSVVADVMQYMSILSDQTGPDTIKGKVSTDALGTNLAYTAPPALDLSPTGGKPALPNTFNAWYPSGYNVLATPPGGSSGGSITLPETCSTAAGAPYCNPQPHSCVVGTVNGTTGNMNAGIGQSWIPTLNFPTAQPPTDQTVMLQEWGVTLSGGAANVNHYVFGTQTPGANVRTRADVDKYFFENDQGGSQNLDRSDEPIAFYFPNDKPDAGHEASNTRRAPAGDFCDRIPMQTDSLALTAHCDNPDGTANYNTCGPGTISAGYIREPGNFQPGMTQRFRIKNPAGAHSWAAEWWFAGYQQSPWLTTGAFTGTPNAPGSTYNANYACTGNDGGNGCINLTGNAYENDALDEYPRFEYCTVGDGNCNDQGSSGSVAMGAQLNTSVLNEGYYDSSGVGHTSPDYATPYIANDGTHFHGFPAPCGLCDYGIAALLDANLSQGYYDIVVNWRNDGTSTVDYFIGYPGGKLYKYKEVQFPYPRPTQYLTAPGLPQNYTDAAGVSHVIGTMFRINASVLPDFYTYPSSVPAITDNDSKTNGWTVNVQQIDTWTGNIQNPDACKVENGGCGTGGGGPGVTCTAATNATTWNFNDKSSTVSLSPDCLTATTSASTNQGVRASAGKSAGKFCFQEAISSMTSFTRVGLGTSAYAFTTSTGADNTAFAYNPSYGPQSGFIGGAQVLSSSGTRPGGSATVTECVDMTAKKLWVTDENMRADGFNWNKTTTANPATGVGGVDISALTGTLFPIYDAQDSGGSATLNAGALVNVTLPSGFSTYDTGVAVVPPAITVTIQ